MTYNKNFSNLPNFRKIENAESRATKILRQSLYDRVLDDLNPEHPLWSLEIDLFKSPIDMLKPDARDKGAYYVSVSNSSVPETGTEAGTKQTATVNTSQGKIEKDVSKAIDAINAIGSFKSFLSESFNFGKINPNSAPSTPEHHSSPIKSNEVLDKTTLFEEMMASDKNIQALLATLKSNQVLPQETQAPQAPQDDPNILKTLSELKQMMHENKKDATVRHQSLLDQLGQSEQSLSDRISKLDVDYQKTSSQLNELKTVTNDKVDAAMTKLDAATFQASDLNNKLISATNDIKAATFELKKQKDIQEKYDEKLNAIKESTANIPRKEEVWNRLDEMVAKKVEEKLAESSTRKLITKDEVEQIATNVMTKNSAKVDNNGDTVIEFGDEMKEFFNYSRERGKFRNEIDTVKRDGFMKLVIIDDDLLIADENDPSSVTADKQQIEALFGVKFNIVSSRRGYTNGRLYLVIQLTPDSPLTNKYNLVDKIVNMRTTPTFKGRMMIEMHIPDYLRYDSLLNNWKDAQILWNFNHTKKGTLCLVLNDGENDKRDQALANMRNFQLKNAFENTCTKIFVPLPSELPNLIVNETTTENLRLLSRGNDKGDHYIWKGKIRPVPKRKIPETQ